MRNIKKITPAMSKSMTVDETIDVYVWIIIIIVLK